MPVKALGTTPFFVRLHKKHREQRHPQSHGGRAHSRARQLG